ncbi:MAG: nicotinate-nucleotide--dimethylbenzimidazole phosphoribosyltransferase, partial [Chloroflexota bacterium]|nr:nicotinate-nucleotide--dimethylbenzimidazole phosphoribosyltransferase [Chloroflexota bacterium]
MEDRLQSLIRDIPPLDARAMQLARERLGRLTKPPGSLGRLEDLAVQLAGIMRDSRPRSGRKVIFV